MIETLPFTRAALHAAYREGVTPADVVAETYRRIAAADDPAIFICLRDIAEVQAEAAALPGDPATHPLWGLPFVVKDNIDVGGMTTTAACPAYAYEAERDAFVVARLRVAGALLIGKTNLDQFATGLVGVRSPYGVPRNALDPEIVPGGSSSGSAVAVGLGLAAFSLGTDTAGSGRVPAALNGIVGLKPSLGALSATGVVPACRTLDTISVFAASVADAYAAYDIACAYDPADAFSREIVAGAPGPVPAGLRIGVPSRETRKFFGDEAQAAMFEAALARLAGQGAVIREIDFTPFYDVAEMLYEGAWVAERYAVVEALMEADPEALLPTTAGIIGAARRLSAADAFRGMYRLKDLARTAGAALGALDLLCVPSIPTFYTRADLEADPVTPNSNLGTYTNFVNLLDLCAIAVPTEPRADGRPGSVTLIAPSGQDALAASVAQLFEAAPALPLGPRPAPETFRIAVCGAHMRGLPLNHELTSRGARFLQTARTAPQYRLYALAGGPPARPGLLRIEKGAAIDLEIWALPETALGGFLAGVPAPLTIGTITLENGAEVHGFLVEAAGVQGAEDITHLGGWRRFLEGRAGVAAP
ncbi:allophanate hydrolase [Paralimibaculum aggregatum]|uniref:Allophanate hydrolase n=1 Tax=Paralimibaculum aggregatum TaxID=3036245 RepID=A0ABQ6LM48_9RHOB|nr:allophanate hydrolase [Limibaculum sp. NKW23]GMG84289.1 allophanate hydrolase [Limibaculum sp. NKW23]